MLSSEPFTFGGRAAVDFDASFGYVRISRAALVNLLGGEIIYLENIRPHCFLLSGGRYIPFLHIPLSFPGITQKLWKYRKIDSRRTFDNKTGFDKENRFNSIKFSFELFQGNFPRRLMVHSTTVTNAYTMESMN